MSDLNNNENYNNEPLVSVYIPYYNDERFLKENIEAVLNQSYKNFELILVNHACTDSSRDIAHSYNDERIIHIDMPVNYGAGSGKLLKEFVKIARGKYSKLLCADDVMLPDALRILVDEMEKDPSIDVLFGDAEYIDIKGKPMGLRHSQARDGYVSEYDKNKFLYLMYMRYSFLSYPANLIKTDALKDIKIDTTLIMFFDMHLWVSLMLKNKNFKIIDKPVIGYRIHPDQVSSVKNAKKAYCQSYFEVEKFYKMYYDLKDLDAIKYICRYSPYAKDLTEADERFFKFVMAHNTLLVKHNIGAYLVIDEMLSDENFADELEKRFNFDIGKFRKLYTYESSSGHPFAEDEPLIERIILLLKHPMLVLKYCVVNTKFGNKYSL